jgi:hypothetical protein
MIINMLLHFMYETLYNIRLVWICNIVHAVCHNYVLTDRKQKVSANCTESEFLNVTCGVPQGSILDPLLFFCYVNDMSISVNYD